MNSQLEISGQVLAIVCPQIGAPSETFIRTHIEHLLPGRTVVITSGVIDDSWLMYPYVIVPSTYGGQQYTPEIEAKVIDFLEKYRVTHILCEFGSVGTGMVLLNQRRLHLPLYVHFFGQDSSEELRKQEMVAYYSWLGSHVSGVITVAKTMTARLKSVGIPAEKLHTNSCGVMVPDNVSDDVAKQPCRFLSVTRLVAKKGVFCLVAAFDKARKQLPGVTLDIIGDGPQRAELEKYIADHRLSDAVFLHGTKPHAFVAEQLKNCGVYAQHSITDSQTGNVEGLPVIILEAAANGLPVISTFHEGIPEAVEHGATGLLVTEGDVDAMADHMICLANSPALRRDMGSAGRQKISEEFTVDLSLSKLRKILGVSMAVEEVEMPLRRDVQDNENERQSVRPNIKRVLLVNHNLFPYETSGTPISTRNHATELSRRGIHTAVLIPGTEVQSGFHVEELSDIKVYKVPRLDKIAAFLGTITPAELAGYLSTIGAILSDFRPDVIHINDYVYMPADIMESFRSSGALIIRNICNDEELCHFDYPVIPTKSNKKLCSGPESAGKCAACFMQNMLGRVDPVTEQIVLKALGEKRAYLQLLYDKYVDGVIFTEPAFMEHFTRFLPIGKDKCFVIPRGIDVTQEKAPEKVVSDCNRICFGFVGNLMFSKGIDIALKAFRLICDHNDFTLHIFGHVIDREYELEIDRLRLNYPDKLVFHGPYNKEQISQIANMIDVCLVPSHFDTYNRVVREMLLCGVPLIVTDFFGASIICDGVNGFKVSVGDEVGLARQILKIIQQPDILVDLFRGARATHIPTVAEEVDGILTAYKKLIKDKVTCFSLDEFGHSSVRIIAFHLPQFHAIPENDAWWGQGFTEWTNVSRAVPRFSGHYQPHVPAELGYYDLSNPAAMQVQASLAQKYGIHGFCYYHYWFNGKLLLETPLHQMLKSGEPDFPFCLCWANENWTRAWDGRSGEVLIGQRYIGTDDVRHIHYLAHFFDDRRYIRIDGKPLFLVYRANQMPDPLRSTMIWREEARKLGHELYLCRVESFRDERTDPSVLGFDASVEFQPDWTELDNVEQLGLSSTSGDRVYRYADVVQRMLAKQPPGYKRFPCVFPSWDNTPRRKAEAVIMHDSSPQAYKIWLQESVKKVLNNRADERIVFINAWNEWGEGNHLEPDARYGSAYLEATRSVVLGDAEAENGRAIFAPLFAASIIIPVFNKVEFTRKCIHSVIKNTAGISFEVIIIDNNSEDGTKAYLAGLSGDVKVVTNDKNVGYTIACNQGARIASGKYLVFLNNDTEPQPGWLKQLIVLAESDLSVGAVGAKLVYPNGVLQEAGGMVFRDGRGWNFGNGDDPDKAQYNQIYEVDYCSGACLLVKHELFHEVSGFDEQYAPAYYEETDLCFGLRKKGFKTLYQPKALVIHHESVTAGTDMQKGYKRFIEINRNKFLHKWHDELMQQEPHPFDTGIPPVTSDRARLR